MAGLVEAEQDSVSYLVQEPDGTASSPTLQKRTMVGLVEAEQNLGAGRDVAQVCRAAVARPNSAADGRPLRAEAHARETDAPAVCPHHLCQGDRLRKGKPSPGRELSLQRVNTLRSRGGDDVCATT